MQCSPPKRSHKTPSALSQRLRSVTFRAISYGQKCSPPLHRPLPRGSRGNDTVAPGASASKLHHGWAGEVLPPFVSRHA